LTEDLVALVDPLVDFSQYDNNHDGYVDTVFIIHAGSGAEANGGNRNLIWSRAYLEFNPVTNVTATYNSITLPNVEQNPERRWQLRDHRWGDCPGDPNRDGAAGANLRTADAGTNRTADADRRATAAASSHDRAERTARADGSASR
jgi:hypothetical protein